MHACVEVKKVAALADIEKYLEEKKDPDMRAVFIRWREEVLNEIPLPPDLTLGTDPVFTDMYGEKVNTIVKNGILKGLKGMFDSYGLKKGDVLRLRVLSLQDNEYAFVPKKPKPIQEELAFEEIEEIMEEKANTFGRGLTLAEAISDKEIDLDRLPTKHRITIDEDSIKKGILSIPPRLAERLGICQTILGP